MCVSGPARTHGKVATSCVSVSVSVSVSVCVSVCVGVSLSVSLSLSLSVSGRVLTFQKNKKAGDRIVANYLDRQRKWQENTMRHELERASSWERTNSSVHHLDRWRQCHWKVPFFFYSQK